MAEKKKAPHSGAHLGHCPKKSTWELFQHFQADLAFGDFAQGSHGGLVAAFDAGAWPWLSMRARYVAANTSWKRLGIFPDSLLR